MKIGLGGQFLQDILTNSNVIDKERGLSASFTMVKSIIEEPQTKQSPKKAGRRSKKDKVLISQSCKTIDVANVDKERNHIR